MNFHDEAFHEAEHRPSSLAHSSSVTVCQNLHFNSSEIHPPSYIQIPLLIQSNPLSLRMPSHFWMRHQIQRVSRHKPSKNVGKNISNVFGSGEMRCVCVCGHKSFSREFIRFNYYETFGIRTRLAEVEYEKKNQFLSNGPHHVLLPRPYIHRISLFQRISLVRFSSTHLYGFVKLK